jgi:hypothetical protein
MLKIVWPAMSGDTHDNSGCRGVIAETLFCGV